MDTLFQVTLVGRLVAFDIGEAAGLLVTPLHSHAVEERDVDPSVQLINIHRVHAGLEPVVFRLKPRNRRVMLPPLILMALAQGDAHPIEDLIVEGQATEFDGEGVRQHFLPHVGFRAFSLEAGAVVVNVALLFDLPDHGATAMAASDQAGEREIVLAAPQLAGVFPVQHILDLFP